MNILRLSHEDNAASILNEYLCAVSLNPGTSIKTSRRMALALRQSPDVLVCVLREMLASISEDALDEAKRDINTARSRDIICLGFFDEDYPSSFRELEDPPLMLYAWADPNLDGLALLSGLESDHSFSLGIVGARECSSYGRTQAADLAREAVSLGGVVISGLASGIDAAAHACAVNELRRNRIVGAGAVAVIGSGILSLYPRENTRLAQAIVEEGGVVLSEFPIKATPRKHFFPQRNRLISSLSEVVVVIEAAQRSGSLITARLALEQGKTVGALPGRVDSPYSAGSNDLLSQGAFICRNIDDVVDELTYRKRRAIKKKRDQQESAIQSRGKEKSAIATVSENKLKSPPSKLTQNDLRSEVISHLSKQTMLCVDELVAYTGTTANNVMAVLGSLELEGEIYRVSQGFYSLEEFPREPDR